MELQMDLDSSVGWTRKVSEAGCLTGILTRMTVLPLCRDNACLFYRMYEHCALCAKP